MYRPKQVPPEFSVQYGERLSDGHHPKDVFESLTCRAPFAIKLKNGSSSFDEPIYPKSFPVTAVSSRSFNDGGRFGEIPGAVFNDFLIDLS